jgi:hypothetical protein
MLSLGNRPQGSKWGYTLAFIGFALLTVYMTVRGNIRLIDPQMLMNVTTTSLLRSSWL